MEYVNFYIYNFPLVIIVVCLVLASKMDTMLYNYLRFILTGHNQDPPEELLGIQCSWHIFPLINTKCYIMPGDYLDINLLKFTFELY